MDGVRGIAAFMVLIFHWFQSPLFVATNTFETLIKRFSTIGQTGVDLFFVLSGFLITRILLSTRGDTGYFKKFFARRSLRILPLYYFFLILFLFGVPWLTARETPPWHQQWYFWVFLQNAPMTFGWEYAGPEPYWSLAVEEHFYLVWPLLVAFLNRKSLAQIAIAMVTVTPLLRYFMLNADLEVYYFSLTRFDALAGGALIAIAEPWLLLNSRRVRKTLAAVLMVMVPIVLIAFSILSGSGSAWLQVTKYTVITLFYCGFLCFVILNSDNSALARILAWSPITYTGKISFGIYVYHSLLFGVCDSCFGERGVILFGLATIMTFTVATLSFEYFESIFLSQKRRFTYAGRDT